ncbi:MAG: hypothetical protein ACR2NH_12055 [Solirubrobacteraceae bacterium]
MATILHPDFGRPRRLYPVVGQVGGLDGRPGGGAELHELYRREDPADRREGDEPPPLVA